MRSLARAVTSLAILALASIFCSSAQAHRVNLYAWAEAGTIRGEGFFSGSSKARNVPVEVRDRDGRLLATVRTGEAGDFSLQVPEAAPPLTLTLKAGEGHQAEFVLTAEDLGVAASSPQPPAAASSEAPAPAPMSQPVSAQLDEAMIERAVKKALDERLGPLTAQLTSQMTRLAEASEKPGLRDVIGGLGWIVGLAGLFAWFKRPGRPSGQTAGKS